MNDIKQDIHNNGKNHRENDFDWISTALPAVTAGLVFHVIVLKQMFWLFNPEIGRAHV